MANLESLEQRLVFSITMASGRVDQDQTEYRFT
jgi:hypothetical protein